MLERALGVLGVRPQSAAYVGDSPADMQAAKNARMPSIAIARGPIQRERLSKENPDHVFGGLREAAEYLASVAMPPDDVTA